jgi:hypothetical protein
MFTIMNVYMLSGVSIRKEKWLYQRTLYKRWILSFTKYNLYQVKVKTPASRQQRARDKLFNT